MMWKVVIALLSMGIGASSAALLANNYPGCFPKFTDARPRPNCAQEEVETWTYWKNMNYKYFATKLTWADAFKACDPWDEAVCENEWPDLRLYYSHPVSILSKAEITDAVIPAYNDACIKSGPLFWTGAKRSDSYGRIIFSDYNKVAARDIGITFDPWIDQGVDCIAINGDDGSFSKVNCNQKLPFLCKIVPNSH